MAGTHTATQDDRPVVLIVDDTPQNIQVLGHILAEQGRYRISIATSGQQALKMMARLEPDLILLDIMMPEMDGLEVCRRLKADPSTRGVPVIFLTGLDKTEDMLEGFAVGGADYVTKPFDTAVLLARMDTHIRLYRQDKQLKSINETLEKRVEMEVNARRVQEQMLGQQAKLAAMGEMIGNIAHQWKQPLSALSITVQDLLEAHGFGELDEAYLQRSVNECLQLIGKMSSTIEDFRDFFRPDREPARFSVAKAVSGAASIVSAALRHGNIELDLKVEQDREIEGYPNQYAHVILNLLGNAKDALKHGGQTPKRITVRVGVTEEGKSRVVIADNGGGIPEAILDKIFEPYFTTKPAGEGTGIGLYMAKTMIERAGGVIRAENAEGGARFYVEV